MNELLIQVSEIGKLHSTKRATAKWLEKYAVIAQMSPEERAEYYKSVQKTIGGRKVFSVIYPTTQQESLVPVAEGVKGYLNEFSRLRDPNSFMTREDKPYACQAFYTLCKDAQIIVAVGDDD